MSQPVSLSKAEVRQALVRHLFPRNESPAEVFRRLGSVQFDPLSPVGCNHDLVLQARSAEYRIGDWRKMAYQDRQIYDGWDKQASLIDMGGWAWRRIFHIWHSRKFQRIFEGHAHAVEAVLSELNERGPLMPKDFAFQQYREEWKGTWFGPSVTKQTLRALWYAGKIMTADRKGGQHLYDLTERIIPDKLRSLPMPSELEGAENLVYDRHRVLGLVRPTAPYEIWSYEVFAPARTKAIASLVSQGKIVPVEVEGMKTHATPEFLELIGAPEAETGVKFIAPLDQLMWDRKLVSHVFGFDYIWEVYVPEAKRRWGYYVLPVLYNDHFVARIEFWAREGVLEIRAWHEEPGLKNCPIDAFQESLGAFMAYSSTKKIVLADGVPKGIKPFVKGVRSKRAKS